MTMLNLCPLCNNESEVFAETAKKVYHKCKTCSGIFLDKDFLPKANAEKSHYLKHNNDTNDIEYQKFVSPITNSVLRDFVPQSSGLDFGSGIKSVVAKVLIDKGFNMQQFDLFFDDNHEVLNNQYDFITCCEVIEHFHYPKKEFILLKKMLKPKGKLYCMTETYKQEQDFETWYYKNDPTHTFFYGKDTFSWICKKFGFSNFEIDNRLIVFSN